MPTQPFKDVETALRSTLAETFPERDFCFGLVPRGNLGLSFDGWRAFLMGLQNEHLVAEPDYMHWRVSDKLARRTYTRTLGFTRDEIARRLSEG